jgi:hypothetical protein
MYSLLRPAVSALLLAFAPWLDAQSLQSASGPKHVFSQICRRADGSAPNFDLLLKPSTRPLGLNIDRACLPLRQTEYLLVDPRSTKQIRTGGGPTMVCGIGYYHGEPIRFCTKG